VVHGLNIASDLEGDSCTLGPINGDMGAFKRSNSADKTEVRLLVLDLGRSIKRENVIAGADCT